MAEIQVGCRYSPLFPSVTSVDPRGALALEYCLASSRNVVKPRHWQDA